MGTLNPTLLAEPAEKLTTDPPDFSESSEDEADRQPLSSFLSSPTTNHHNGTRSPTPESISESMIPSHCAILDYKSIERTSHSNQSSHVVMEEETDTKKVGVKTKKNSSDAPGAKRKRTAEEVEENKRLAQVLIDFLVTVKAAPHECVIRTGQS